MQVTLESDIVERLESEFVGGEFPTALQLLASSGLNGRVARCVVVSAAGSLDGLRRQIETALRDHRDVIIAGEYDIGMQRVRDLRASFLVSDPLDFWIGNLAMFLNSRDFYLVSLESRNATNGPFEYTCDRGQGIAVFKRGDQMLTITKENRQWRAIGDATVLRRFQLHIPYDDADQFRNQLAWLLSGK